MKSIEAVFSNQAFDQLLLEHVDIVQDFFKKVPTDSYMPEILVFEMDGSVQTFKVVLDDDRQETVRHVGMLAHKMGLQPLAIIMVAEFWVREVPENDPISSRPISSYEDKQEVISIVGMTVDNRTNGAMLLFDRGEGNSIVLKENKTVIYSCEKKGGGKTIYGNLLAQFFIGYSQAFVSARN